jgi:hypothetical protein
MVTAEYRMKLGIGAITALCVCVALATPGCRTPKTGGMRIEKEADAPNVVARSVVENKLITNALAMSTIQMEVKGSLIMDPTSSRADASEDRPSAGGKPTPSSAPREMELTGGRFIAKRIPGEPRLTRFHCDFIRNNSVFSLLSAENLFWVRLPVHGAFFFVGSLDYRHPRPVRLPVGQFQGAVPTIRPQDLGTLLLCDDLFPESGGTNASYMEVWPQFYILHIMRPGRSPEPIYSRLWIDRQSLNVIYHQLFDATGALVAEAYLSDHRFYPTIPKSKGVAGSAKERAEEAKGPKEASLPGRAICYWPKDNIAMRLEFLRVHLNEKFQEGVFAQPDTSKGAVVTLPSE